MLWQLKTHLVPLANRALVKTSGISLLVLYNHWAIETRYASTDSRIPGYKVT